MRHEVMVRETERILRKRLSAEQAAQLLPSARHLLYARNPILWAEVMFGIDPRSIDWGRNPEYKTHVWHGTPNPLMAVQEAYLNKQWIAIEGAVSVGKTVFLAILALHFWYFNEKAVVITTAPKEDQLTLNIWRWIPQFFPKLGVGIMDTLRIRRFPRDDSWILRGYTAGVSKDEIETSATRAQGLHAPNMLIIVEEAPGVPKPVLSAYENSCTSENNLIIAVGNPNNVNDTLHDFSRRKRVRHIRISGFDHPNVVLNNPDFVPGAQTKQGLAQLLDKYGDPNNPIYLSRAEGISPEQSVDSLIRYEWCEQAATRDKEAVLSEVKDKQWAMGVDVANSIDGDKAAICLGRASVVESVVSFPCDDANELGRRVVEQARSLHILPERVGVDGVGVGAGTVNECKRLGFRVTNIQSAAAAEEYHMHKGVPMTERFNNLRSQMWWQARLDLQYQVESGLCLPYDVELFADLCTPKFKIERGVIKVQTKEELKKQLGRSPNKGDAFVYWNWVRQRRRVGVLVAPTEEKRQTPQKAFDNSPFKAQRHRVW